MNVEKKVITEEAAKAKARALCAALKDLNIVTDLAPRRALEVVARLENEKNWSTLNAKQKKTLQLAKSAQSAKSTPAKSEHPSEYCCASCEGQRLIQDSTGRYWPCPQCLLCLTGKGAGPTAEPDSELLTHPLLIGSKRLLLSEVGALWQMLQMVPWHEEKSIQVLGEPFLHFRAGESRRAVKHWLMAMCADNHFSPEKAHREVYSPKLLRNESLTSLVKKLSGRQWRVGFEIGNKYGAFQCEFTHGYGSKEAAWEAVETYSELGAEAFDWYRVSWLGNSSTFEGEPSPRDVAEWVGLHYGKNWSAEAQFKRHAWVQRYKYAHDVD